VVHLLQRDTLPTPEGGWKFSSSAYRNTYKKHIKSLEHIKETNEAALSVLLVTIYSKCTEYVFTIFTYLTRTSDSMNNEANGLTHRTELTTQNRVSKDGVVKGIDPTVLPSTYNSASIDEERVSE
jgi:hypothetical protein